MKKTTFLLLAFAAFGCAEKMDSSDVRTSGIRAEFEVIAFGGDSNSATQARALLYGGSDLLVLTNEDRLEVTQVGGETKQMLRSGGDDYLASFDAGTPEDTEFVFSLERGPDDTDAPDSSVTMPPAFVVQGMENNGTVTDNGQVAVSRTSNVVLTWDEDHTNDKVNYGIGDGSDCLWGEDVSSGQTNTGSLTIPASIFDTKAGEDASTCGATLYVELERVGTRDAAYKSGTVRAKQRFWIQFVSTP